MVIANPPLAEPVIDPGGVTIKPPFEMGVANLKSTERVGPHCVESRMAGVKLVSCFKSVCIV